MESLFKQADITVSDYQSEKAKGFQYSVPLNGTEHTIIVITEYDGDAPCPYMYSMTRADDKEREMAYALVLEHECQKDNAWAKDMKETAITLWNMMKNEGGAVFYPLSDRDVHISPCIYDKEMADASPSDVEYYLTHDNVISSGGTIFDVCKTIVHYDKEMERYKDEAIRLQEYFEKNCLNAWDKPYAELTERERDALGFFSDWHKDMYGYRPHGDESNRCLQAYNAKQTKNKDAKSIERD